VPSPALLRGRALKTKLFSKHRELSGNLLCFVNGNGALSSRESAAANFMERRRQGVTIAAEKQSRVQEPGRQDAAQPFF
jgi:hypothetical protein